MKGYLEKRGSSTFRMKVFLGNDSSGRKRYASRTFHGNKREAQDALRGFILEVGGSSADATAATVGELARRWLAIAKPSLSPTTYERYQWTVDRIILPRLGDTKLRALRASDLDTLYAELLAHGGKNRRRLAPASVDKVHRLLHRLLSQAVKWGWISANPASNATPPRVPKPQLQVPDADTVLSLIGKVEGAEPDLATLLRVAAVSGARRGELCALRWSDIDLVGETVSIARAVVGRTNAEVIERQTKTGNRRRIAIDADTVDMLARHRDRCELRAEAVGGVLKEDAFVFSPDPTGSRAWRPDGVSLALRRVRKEYGIDAGTLLALRHFAATQLLTAGVDVRTVAGRLGHANPSTTLSRYAEWLSAADQVAAVKMGELLARAMASNQAAGDASTKAANGDEAPTSPPSPGARREARGAGTRPRSAAERAPP